MFPRIQPFGSEDCSSLGKVYSRQATESVNCENSSLSFCHRVLSDLNCFQESYISTNFLSIDLVCASFFARSLCFCRTISCAGISIECVSDCPADTCLSDKSETASVDTELIIFHKTWRFQVDRVRILMVLVHGIHGQKEYCYYCHWLCLL